MNDSSILLPSTAARASATLLCVDDEQNILSALRRLFRHDGYRVLTTTSGDAGIKLLENEQVDLVISDMRMPEMNGARFLEIVSSRWPDTLRILLTGHADITSTIEAINQGKILRYISKPWDDQDVRLIVRHALEHKQLERDKRRLEALTHRQNEELRELNLSLEARVEERTAELRLAHDALAAANEKLKTSFLTSIKVFSNLIEVSEGARSGHSRRVADLSRRIAVKIGLDRTATQDVMLAGLLHDIGKIGMPDALLAKSVNQMNAEELILFKKHPIKGELALMALDGLRNAARLLRSHHERYDGQGYPEGLSATDIPLGARILAVANDYDGLQIGSFSAKRLSSVEALAFIQQSRGKRYDPQVLDVFASLNDSEIVDKAEKEWALGPNALRPGMVLSRDLFSREGALLLAADSLLDNGLIKQIRGYTGFEEQSVVIHVRADRIETATTQNRPSL
ncbi:MAG: Response regulator c-di-GMP phosphodiesterase, RpfG family, contains REC and HD-GYP domain [Candidatus Nitrotoga sp. CP45]|nr:MAG: Response regulator c-di-GMP phosphodiesterase, RpfG family, contains REC and HD-GYP domain [Candidatus Nitrotoga sp. CP45]